MTDYMEYIKGGDILIAPSLDYKHQYILKCGLCEEYYGKFEQFFAHYLSHYDMESNDEDDNLSQSGIVQEQELFEDIIVDDGEEIEDAANEYKDIAPTSEHMSDSDEEEAIYPFDEVFEVDIENVIAKDETISLEVSDMNYSKSAEISQEQLELEELATKTYDEQLGNDEPIDEFRVEKNTNVNDKSNTAFIQTFMKSKENVTALIAAYKNESHLWDFSLPVKYRKKAKRIETWNKISIDLKEKNVVIESNQVAAIITHLRQKYRERKRSGALAAIHSNEILPTWVFKQLHFLNSFVESNPIGIIDIHQDLSPKQSMEILNVLKKCPHLWDTNTIEYYCTNKREVAFTEMKNIILEEMDLEVDEDTLKSYLKSVHNYFMLEKRRKMGFVGGTKVNIKYYDRLIFLYDHVGPFKCKHCKRSILTPMSLKAHESQHVGTIPFECPQCDKEFKLVDSYVYHLRRHMGDLNHECQDCGKKFLKIFDLEEHRRCHTGAKPYCCELCGASFRQRTGFSMHMKRHGKKYISFCPYCSKGFYSKDSMNMHARSHTNQRDFVCTTCGKAFKTRKTLKSHVAIHENGNHECDLCGKTFKNRINLWQHKRKHRLNGSAHTSELISPFNKK